jgi:hypothetical protein
MGGEGDARHATLGKLGEDGSLVLPPNTDPPASVLMRNRKTSDVPKCHTPLPNNTYTPLANR